MERLQATRLSISGVALGCLLGLVACKNGGSRRASDAARWVDRPSSGSQSGSVFTFKALGVEFEIPDTLYVYKDCAEASHTPDGTTEWIPVLTCRSRSGRETEGVSDASGPEPIDLTFYVTKKTRTLDERSVTWFESKYKQAGLTVDELAYQGDYQKKEGIYAKLYVLDESTGSPTREIVQFMFPRNDVVFIARMEYPFGDRRSVEKDWEYILWNFDWLETQG